MTGRLLHVFSTFAIGGPQVRFAAIANRYGRRWRHEIVAMDGNLAARERLGADLDVGFPDIPIAKGDTLGNVRRFRAFLKRNRPDCLVTSNWGSIEWAMAATLSGIRHVHMEDGFGPEERTTQIPRRVWTRRIVLHRRQVVVPSRVLERIATGVWGLSPRRVRYVPNGVDLARFRQGREGEGAIPVIGTVAALRAEKNLGRLIDAFAALTRPARLLIVGGGPERAALEARAAALGVADRVDFAGGQADTAPWYRRMDIFALSSDTEQMPLSVLEAMGSGLPVAATDVGDISGMLAPASGAYVVGRDVAALAQALDALLADPDLRATLGAANRARAEAEFDQERMFETYAALFDGTA